MWGGQNRNGSSRFGLRVQLSLGGGYAVGRVGNDVVFREGLFEVVGALIVKNVEVGCEPV
jgi:hypothetical protein